MDTYATTYCIGTYATTYYGVSDARAGGGSRPVVSRKKVVRTLDKYDSSLAPRTARQKKHVPGRFWRKTDDLYFRSKLTILVPKTSISVQN